MMTISNRIASLIGLDFEAQAKREVEQEEELAVRAVAERFSRGSVGILGGAFHTQKDHDRMLENAGLPPRKS